jgi:hypothetical protein
MSPVVSMTLAAPEASLPGVITAELSVANNGGVPADLTLDFQGQVQPVSLAAGASLLLTRTFEITRDLTIRAVLSGEATQTVTHTVRYSAPPALAVAPAARYPEGATTIPYTLTNPGILDLTVDAVFELSESTNQRISGQPSVNSKSEIQNPKSPARATALSQALADQVVVRNHPLPQGSVISDTLTYSLTKGTYSLAYDTAYQSGQAGFQVRGLDDLTLVTQLSSTPGVSPTLTALITNVGYNAFSGTLQVVGTRADPATAPFFQSEQAVSAPVDGLRTYSTTVDTTSLTPGVYTVTASLLAGDRRPVATSAVTLTIRGPAFVVTEAPAATSLGVGETYTFTFAVENRGDMGDSAIFRFALGDVTDQQQIQQLAVGGRGVFTFSFSLPEELASSTYVASYAVSGTLGVGATRGEWRIAVQGIDLGVQANTDKLAYEEGEIAQVTLTIANQGSRATPDLYALVSFNGITQTQSFSLSHAISTAGYAVRNTQYAPRITQSAINLTFPVAVTFTGDRKLFYGVFVGESDRSVYFNTLYLDQLQPAVTVLTDKQVYQPGETVQATIVTTFTGQLNVVAPGYAAAIQLPAAGFSFALPDPMTKGAYAIYYTLMDCGCAAEGREQAAWFDVDAPDAEMMAVALDQTRYGPGDTLTATLSVAANQEMDALLRSWIRYPDGAEGATSERTVHLLAIPNNPVTVTAVITDTQQGIHLLLYTLSSLTTGMRGYGVLAASEPLTYTYGLAAFDVGGGALIGLTTDKSQYSGAAEPVEAAAQVYAAWPTTGALVLTLDTGAAQTQTVQLAAGFQTIRVILAGPIAPGERTLTADLRMDGYATARAASFAYGANLPDLRPTTAWLTGGGTPQLNALVFNEGASAAGASSVSFYLGTAAAGTLIATAAAPPVAAGAGVSVTVAWPGGSAGAALITVRADSGATVAEYNEANNEAAGPVAAGPAVAPTVAAGRDGGDVLVAWTHNAANAGGYQVWYSTNFYFTPGSDCDAPPAGQSCVWRPAPAASYRHAGAAADVAHNYAYQVFGLNAAGYRSTVSNRVAEFGFGLTPGSP